MLLLAVAPAADATFPGQNGRLALTYGAGDVDDGLTSGIFAGLPYASGSPLGWTAQACGSQPPTPADPQGPNCLAGAGASFNLSGSVVAFGATTALGNGQLAVAAADGTNLTLLPQQTANDVQPAFAPGRFGSAANATLAFQGVSGQGVSANTVTDIFTLSLAMGSAPATAAELTQLTRFGDATAPDWSARNRIAFSHAGQLWAVNASGGALTQLTKGGGDQASWSPGGTAVAFVRSGQVWRMAVGASGAGTQLRQLTRVAGGASWPVWSPDGRTIAFLRSGNVASIATIPAGGGRARTALNGMRAVSDVAALGAGGMAWQSWR
ncbi:hypothetical protein VSS74_29590 [Conexibacter stalactiti]|uniref:Uncharacterized protein n=1 Tax=Conexibacter stalactiti TaxID=1940611 RepID=A0ABU4HYY5_9ACTN|nr:hypothetical protein [Conexibacter stalactiti]MDW5598551.1 hypothetical protein [Conexibacter stalactiti]MEC5039193.1 hypothetical protein [Conexibacter stalactiti]